MGRAGFPPITPLSAALTLVQWTQVHGREPRLRECAGSGNLLWYTTYLKTFQPFGVSSWRDVLSTAFDLVNGACSAVIISVVSAEVAPRRKPCLNAPECRRMIPDEGPHIRFCSECRPTNHHRPARSPEPEPVLTRAQLRRWGVGRSDWYGEDIDLAD